MARIPNSGSTAGAETQFYPIGGVAADGAPDVGQPHLLQLLGQGQQTQPSVGMLLSGARGECRFSVVGCRVKVLPSEAPSMDAVSPRLAGLADSLQCSGSP